MERTEASQPIKLLDSTRATKILLARLKFRRFSDGLFFHPQLHRKQQAAALTTAGTAHKIKTCTDEVKTKASLKALQMILE